MLQQSAFVAVCADGSPRENLTVNLTADKDTESQLLGLSRVIQYKKKPKQV